MPADLLLSDKIAADRFPLIVNVCLTLPEHSAPMKTSRSSIQSFLDNRRSMEQALADLVAKYAVTPSPELASIIGHLELEVAERNESAVEANAPRNPSLLAAPEPLPGEERRRGGGRHIIRQLLGRLKLATSHNGRNSLPGDSRPPSAARDPR